MYDLSITEFDPYKVDKIEKFDYKDDGEYFMHEPTHKVYYFNYKGETIGIEIQYRTRDDKRRGKYVSMKSTDFEEGAGEKFKVGDIVKINQKSEKNHLFGEYEFADRLHIVTNTPKKQKGQKYFQNTYNVITNHNQFDDGCHETCFREEELELFTGKLDKDSPILFLSNIYKGNIKIAREKYMDLITGRIALNNGPSFRDIDNWEQTTN